MRQVKDIYKSFIMIFSEIIWVYYLIVLFTSVELNTHVSFELTWLVAAGICGFLVNTLVKRTSNHLIVYLGNIFALGFIVFLNWRSAIPEGVWGFGLAVSFGIGFIFIRSARTAYRKPARREILQHFEGNIIFYIAMALIFTLNEWHNETFHFLFVAAVIGSLLGMVSSLENHGDTYSNQPVKIMKVGKSGWFAGLAVVFFICIPLFSLTLLLPSVYQRVVSVGMGIEGGLKWLFLKVDGFFGWLASITKGPDTHIVPEVSEEQFITPDGMGGTVDLLPSKWLIAGPVIILFVITIWYLAKHLTRKRLVKVVKPQNITISKEAWWRIFQGKLKSLVQELKLRWRMSFRRYYHSSVYWYYYRIHKWGAKNGFPRFNTETSQEYIKRIIKFIPEKEVSFTHQGREYKIPELLERLNKDYQAAYYGSKREFADVMEYRLLINSLQNIKVKDKGLSCSSPILSKDQ